MRPTLLLDLDGTLVDTVPDLAAALNRLMASRQLAPFSHAETASFVGDGVARLVERAFAARGLTADLRAIGQFAEDYGANAAVESRPYPGIANNLNALAGEGWRLAVCTNKPEAAARRLLEAVGLAHLMAAIGGGDSFPVRKPDPAHIQSTLRAAGGEPARAIMTGDNVNDVLAATGAGLPCIFAAWGYGPLSMAAGATAIAHDPSEMAALALQLNSSPGSR